MRIDRLLGAAGPKVTLSDWAMPGAYTGQATLNVPSGNYVVGSHVDSNGDGTPDRFLGQLTLGLDCGENQREYLILLKLANGKRHGCRWHRHSGSELPVFEPEEVVWDGTEQLYPFVFDSEGAWDVTVSVEPPEGFVADHESLSEDVESEVESLQFTITEVGSDLVPTKTTFHITHKGKRHTLKSEIDIKLTPNYARSRGFNVDKLRDRGLIVNPKERSRLLRGKAKMVD